MVDTSAIVAVIFGEDEADAFARKLAMADARFVSAATLLEATVVLTRRTRSRDDRDLANFRAAVPLTLVPLDEQQSALARSAYLRFGQASGHPAHLNFGDCFSYATARHLGAPLLFKGADFSHTDIEPA